MVHHSTTTTTQIISLVVVTAILDNGLLTLLQDCRLPGHIRQSSNNRLVSIHESKQSIRYAHFLAEALHQLLRGPQVMPGDPGIQVMNCLELQSAMEEIQPLGTVDIHGRAEHLLRERFVRSKIGSGHGEVGRVI